MSKRRLLLAVLLAHSTPSDQLLGLAFVPAPARGSFLTSRGRLAPLKSGMSWVPWPGTNDPIIDTDRDAMLRRERCSLCRGKGKVICRW